MNYEKNSGLTISFQDEVVKNENGDIEYINCSIIEDAKEQGIKPKGTIHWLDRKTAIKVKTRKFNSLLKEGTVYEKGKLDQIINENLVLKAKWETSLLLAHTLLQAV